MKKIIFLMGFILLCVFPPIAWEQEQTFGTYGAGSAEYMRQMQQQQQQQATVQKNEDEKQQSQDQTAGFNQKQFATGQGKKAQDDQQKQVTGAEPDKTIEKNFK